MTTVLKLGGSVVTEKATPETVDEEALQQAAAAIAAADVQPVIVHGGGSFGHHHAAAHGVSTTEGTDDAAAVRAITGAMRRLNDAVVGALADAGVPAVPLQPFAAGVREANDELRFCWEPVEAMLESGFVPVLCGDVVAHRGKGATILSGDELVVAAARAVSAERVGVCSSVPGVYDQTETVVDRIQSLEDIEEALGGSDVTDVTGGMAGKVKQLLALEAAGYIFDIDGLAAFLRGGNPGTRVG
ncbi:isopentenyl phosphate kinase [Natronomonas pharaonis DSM 2160]|uniref:Isopentenyl phosphate kinase n=1 Tax=Natronomonas pharaonis (strain ATCC 35678 / DSM 2160 / CIP 103997 / JCM 8858 / NBRC 14720 / NCIMB 2260 / Gabara) TaxID=348780 RepID=A0A1U7EWN0_NATPD|nr:isopentenyl phosphate kinase [Natronomonas pharaonis]CAI49517.1 isopentenyl phosphate kinase [Natronomonas pharaonis DSM 2160]